MNMYFDIDFEIDYIVRLINEKLNNLKQLRYDLNNLEDSMYEDGFAPHNFKFDFKSNSIIDIYRNNVKNSSFPNNYVYICTVTVDVENVTATVTNRI